MPVPKFGMGNDFVCHNGVHKTAHSLVLRVLVQSLHSFLQNPTASCEPWFVSSDTLSDTGLNIRSLERLSQK